MALMKEFYCIKIINTRTNERGYLFDSPKGVAVTETFEACTIRFDTYQQAQQYIRDNKIERHGIKAYIRDSGDIMKEGKDESSMRALRNNEKLFVIENNLGQRLFFDTKEDAYFFSNGEIGACAWNDIEQANEFIAAYKKEHPHIVFMVKELKNENN